MEIIKYKTKVWSKLQVVALQVHKDLLNLTQFTMSRQVGFGKNVHYFATHIELCSNRDGDRVANTSN